MEEAAAAAETATRGARVKAWGAIVKPVLNAILPEGVDPTSEQRKAVAEAFRAIAKGETR